MIINDKYGDKLTLSKERLAEIEGGTSFYPFHVLLADVKRAYKSGDGLVLVHGRCAKGLPNSVNVTFSPSKAKLGCREFSPETFAKILKAAGVRKTKVARKKAKKVTR